MAKKSSVFFGWEIGDIFSILKSFIGRRSMNSHTQTSRSCLKRWKILSFANGDRKKSARAFYAIDIRHLLLCLIALTGQLGISERTKTKQRLTNKLLWAQYCTAANKSPHILFVLLCCKKAYKALTWVRVDLMHHRETFSSSVPVWQQISQSQTRYNNNVHISHTQTQNPVCLVNTNSFIISLCVLTVVSISWWSTGHLLSALADII